MVRAKDWVVVNHVRLLVWGVFVALLLNLVVGGVWLYRTVTLFDPLGPYAPQTIELPQVVQSEGGGLYPGLFVKDDVWPDLPVAGEKCSDETVQVEGGHIWLSVVPPGFSSRSTDARTIRLQGCTRFAYKNPVPEEVRDRVRALAAQGVTTSVWSLQGKETPFRPGTNDPGSPEFWSTRNFAIVWEA